MWPFKNMMPKNDGLMKAKKKISITAVRLKDDNTFSLFVVGESNYQGALRNLAGGHTKEGVKLEKLALLVPEPTNAFDSNAVFVMIDDKKVGYLSRDDAVDFHSSMHGLGKRGSVAAVDSVIVGGFIKKDGSKAHFGVRLDLSFPFDT